MTSSKEMRASTCSAGHLRFASCPKSQTSNLKRKKKIKVKIFKSMDQRFSVPKKWTPEFLTPQKKTDHI